MQDDEDRVRAHAVWRRAERFKKVSDRLIGLGPWGIGIDGLLAFIPVVSTIYSVTAGGWILLQGIQAKASPLTLAIMTSYVALDSGSSVIPIPVAGPALDLLFQGHLLAANALQRDIEQRHGVPIDDIIDITPRTADA